MSTPKTCLVLLALIAIGCGRGGAPLDFSSANAFVESIEEIKASLDPKDAVIWEDAMQHAIFSPNLFILALKSEEESLRIIRKKLAGKSVEEILAEYREKVRQEEAESRDPIQSMTRRERAELDAAMATLEEQLELAKGVVVTKGRFFWDEESSNPTPKVELEIKSSLDKAISRVFLTAKLQSPGREVPWVDASFYYEVSGGIEPGETDRGIFGMNGSSDWADAPKDRDDMVLTLTVVKVLDAAGAPIFDVAGAQKEVDRKTKGGRPQDRRTRGRARHARRLK